MRYEEIKPLLDEIVGLGADFQVTLTQAGVGYLWVSNVRQSSENYHPILASLTRFYGRLNKEIFGGVQSWAGNKDGQVVRVYNVAKCKITGYRTVEKKKTVEVETDEVETTEEPIYDCSSVE